MFVSAGEALVTVVVVTYKGARFLDRCLDAVAGQRLDRPGGTACWVVDNASADGTADVLAARRDGVRVIRSDRNLGFAGGNNLALREVPSPYVVLLNDDAVPQDGWLEQLLRPFDDDPRVAAVASKLLLLPRFVAVRLPCSGERQVDVACVRRDGVDVTRALIWDPLLVGPPKGRSHPCRPGSDLLVPVPDAGETLSTPVEVSLDILGGPSQTVTVPAGSSTANVVNSAGTALTRDAYAADRGFGLVDDGRFDTPAEIFGGCGASLALRSRALQDVGLLDEDWFLYYEDVDLCWRLRRRGWTVRYSPRSVARHHHSASVGTRSNLHAFHDSRNRLLTLVKNASPLLIARTVGRYPLTTVSVALSALQTSRRNRDAARPDVVLRLRVLLSFLRLLPGVLSRRRQVQRRATVPRREVESWLGREWRTSPYTATAAVTLTGAAPTGTARAVGAPPAPPLEDER